jgi:hypothetical protein
VPFVFRDGKPSMKGLWGFLKALAVKVYVYVRDQRVP